MRRMDYNYIHLSINMHFSEYQRIEKWENRHFWYRAMEEQVLELMVKQSSSAGKILDAGCGTGGFSAKLMEFGEVYAVDINPVAIKYAKKKGLPHLSRASIDKLPYPADFFETGLCLDVLYHEQVKDDLKALQELYRVLKPGGLLILRLPAFEALRGAHDVVVRTRHRYTVAEVRLKLSKTGFSIKKISYVNFLLSLLLLVKRSLERRKNSHYFHSDTAPLPPLLNEMFYRILKSENKLLNFLNLPFGSSLLALAVK